MLIDELRQRLKANESDIAAITTFWTNNKCAEQYEKLSHVVNQENFWQHPQRTEISSEHHALKELVDSYSSIVDGYKEMLELLDMFQDDETQLELIKVDVYRLCKQIGKFKLELLLNKKEDHGNCYISINAGAGGTESQDWASMLLRMYIRFCEREGLGLDVLDYQSGEEAGIKSATLYVKGKNAAGILKSENGIHRLVRISPYDANKRRHTSFAAVSILPEYEDVAIEILEKDLRIDTYRAGGAGGQHVNKTDSAVRITHLPTNIVVQCQNERSQMQNRAVAMKMLKAKLVERQEQQRKAQSDSIEKKKIEWGSQIRSYVLHPYKMVKDHRTELESPQPDLVLDGELMDFIQGYLVSAAGE